MTNNPELDAVWSTIPERAAVDKALTDVRKKKASMTPAVEPDTARQDVINAAVAAVTAGDPWPKDLGRKAADAYTTALATNAEWTAVVDAERGLVARAESVRELYRDDALEALGGRLEDVLSEVRAIVARSGHIVDGDTAIAAGGTAVDDYATLRMLLGSLANIRAAQRSVLMPARGNAAPELADAYRQGLDEVRGLRVDPAPDHIVPALLGRKPRGVEYLIWLAECGRAWVPTSEADLNGERLMIDVGVSDGPVTDYSARVTPIPAPSKPVRHGFEQTPDISLTTRNN